MKYAIFKGFQNILGGFLGHKDKGHLVDPAYYKRVYRKGRSAT
ncbi:MAG: hypothetical protein V3W28_05210 [Thermoplasmata archaeon]